jgi:hypothetical protein
MEDDQRLRELYRIYEELDNGQKETLLAVAKRLWDIKKLLMDSELQIEKKEEAKVEDE